ncbi:excisionase [Pelomonas sp. PFR6]|uniref:Excisionase n=1 Tax=Roseateles violae TaxID=3058042 RepID=A0ABT8DPB5_9BURK|nr:excisionase [Pelomonas sp. PFR6]MDN3920002.1 excisionase [Pelomonas sp. PFR6]
MNARPVRFILLQKFAELTGYTEKALRRKIEEHVWREGREYRRSPDGRIHIDVEWYESWVTCRAE